MSNFNNDVMFDHETVDFEILFPNLEGRESAYNDRGKRNFRLKINDEEIAKQLIDDGWNVRISKPNSDKYEPYYFVTVSCKFKSDKDTVRQDPEIHLINSKNDIIINAANVNLLDMKLMNQRDIVAVDLVLHPYHWTTPQGDGISAYLSKMWVVIADDPFADRWANYSAKAEDEQVPF